ncbi:uncharacterized protein LOC110103786 [Dendrobium catenatum]|uniref:Uncharacterized protein n=1 Tax=Dendrobium catenatum TaxID=906689 RepID=A0A2I0VV43_9ASPA|nr:uncharacterized protein LOC110103786 [Dendrobium catenatum]PKU67277.1 hypothetical protein MA16_Dca016006 [Dendrobium catenatum]
MAIRFSFSNTFFPVNGKNCLVSLRTTVICNCNLKIEASSSHGERFSLGKQVFEDREIGVKCYRDEKGELVCEGYDEGPRFTVRPSECIELQRQARRYNLLRRRLNGSEFKN